MNRCSPTRVLPIACVLAIWLVILRVHSDVDPPSFQDVSFSAGNISLNWSSVAGQQYQLEFKTDLSQTTWSNTLGIITATNVTASATEPIPPDASQRFYRLTLLVPDTGGVDIDLVRGTVIVPNRYASWKLANTGFGPIAYPSDWTLYLGSIGVIAYPPTWTKYVGSLGVIAYPPSWTRYVGSIAVVAYPAGWKLSATSFGPISYPSDWRLYLGSVDILAYPPDWTLYVSGFGPVAYPADWNRYVGSFGVIAYPSTWTLYVASFGPFAYPSDWNRYVGSFGLFAYPSDWILDASSFGPIAYPGPTSTTIELQFRDRTYLEEFQRLKAVMSDADLTDYVVYSYFGNRSQGLNKRGR